MWKWVGLLAGCAISAMPERAEYAFRWEPAMGGPATVEAVHRILGGRTRSTREFLVRYHRLPSGVPRPQGAAAIFRERTRTGEPTEFRLKFRRTAPFDPVDVCPAGTDASYEKDVSFGGGDSTVDVFSVSCTTTDSGFARRMGSEPVPCAARVERHDGRRYRVEIWTLSGGGILMEVSHRSGDEVSSLREFGAMVRALIAAGARPATGSKTEMGMACGDPAAAVPTGGASPVGSGERTPDTPAPGRRRSP